MSLQIQLSDSHLDLYKNSLIDGETVGNAPEYRIHLNYLAAQTEFNS